MKRRSRLQVSICLVVIVSFLTVSCAEVMTQPGQAAFVCGAGGAAVGAAIGGAASRDWTGALIGAAIGALVGATTCFAIAEYRNQQVASYQETQRAINYQPAQGDTVQITHYEITPAAAAPGTDVAFKATYYVMTANADQDVPITEVRIVNVFDPKVNGYRELGRVPTQVTVKPGTRQADGKIPIGSGVAQGQYQIVLQVAKNGVSDTKALPLVVTTHQGILSSPAARIVQVSAPGAKRVEAPTATPVAAPGPSSPAPAAPPAGESPLSALGERTPQGAPPTPAVARVGAAGGPAASGAPAWRRGSEWAVRWESPGGKGSYLVTVAREETVDGVDYYVLASGNREAYWRKSDFGYYMDKVEGVVETRRLPPNVLYPWPLIPGKSWQQRFILEKPREGKTEEIALACRVENEEPLSVPAGTFKAVKTACHDERSGALRYENWYSPEVQHWIRDRHYLSNGVMVREVIAFRLP